MKKLFFYCIMLVSTTAYSQEIYLGLSGGPAKRFSGNNPNNIISANIVEKGVYLRFNTNKRLSFMGSMSHFGNTSFIYDAMIFDVDYSIDYIKERLDYLEFRYSVQYNISPKMLKARNIDQYVGLQLANRNNKLSDQYYITDRDGQKSDYTRIYSLFEYLGGLSYSVTYSLPRVQIGINTSVMVGDKDFTKFPRPYLINEQYPSSILSANINIGYKL